MRHAHSLKCVSVAWMLALPGCLAAPTFAKWKFHAGPETKEPWVVGTKQEIVAGFAKKCAVEYQVYGSSVTCLDSPESEKDVEIKRAVVKDPTVFSARIAGSTVLVEALRDGTTTLDVEVKGRHGKAGSRTITLAAATPSGVRAEYRTPPGVKREEAGCLDGRSPRELWFDVGERFKLHYQAVRDQTVVIGAPLVVTAKGTSGLREVSFKTFVSAGLTSAAEGEYVMSEPGTFTMSAPGFPAFVTGGAYTCSTLTGIAFTAVEQNDSGGSFDLAHMVGDDVVCRGGAKCPVTITVETPAVCAVSKVGPDKPKVTVSASPGRSLVHRLSAGTCRISAVLAGTAHTASAKFEFK